MLTGRKLLDVLLRNEHPRWRIRARAIEVLIQPANVLDVASRRLTDLGTPRASGLWSQPLFRRRRRPGHASFVPRFLPWAKDNGDGTQKDTKLSDGEYRRVHDAPSISGDAPL